MLGFELCSQKEFDILCDKWDALNNFTPNISKKTQLYYNNGDTNNIFGFILKQYDIEINITGYESYETKPYPDDACIGIICFNTKHTWALRKHSDNNWWIHDSLRYPIKLQHNKLNSKSITALYFTLK